MLLRRQPAAGLAFAALTWMSVGWIAAAEPNPERRLRESPSPDLTYCKRIARLMNRHCVPCHRTGGVAPFPLQTYEDVIAHGPMVREVVLRGIMPPWFAAPTGATPRSRFANDASLSKQERDDLVKWLEGDQEQGDPADAPAAVQFNDGWSIGQPDVIYEFPTAIAVPATGVMPYQYVTVNTRLPDDRWVQAVEVVPGDPRVVHHVLVFAVQPGEQVRDVVNYWAGYVPGRGVRIYPDSYGRRLPRGSRLVFQMHYTPNGTATSDKTRIGLRFAGSTPRYEAKTGSVINTHFSIPPRARNYRVDASIRVPHDMAVLGFMPHHHLRGVAGRYQLMHGNGRGETLLAVPDYDFNWQLFYEYAEPKFIPQGATIRYEAWYDNSAENPANPNPNTRVRWGLQTVDEMHVGYLEYAVPTASP